MLFKKEVVRFIKKVIEASLKVHFFFCK